MADDSRNATTRGRSVLGTRQTVTQSRVMVETATVEVAAAASASTIYTFFRVPSRARLLAASKVAWDDLASSGSPTLSIGVKAVLANITTSATAINSALDLATVSSTTGVGLIGDPANWGKQMWEIAGATTDPGGVIDITLTIAAAATNTGGTLSAELWLSTDA